MRELRGTTLATLARVKAEAEMAIEDYAFWLAFQAVLNDPGLSAAIVEGARPDPECIENIVEGVRGNAASLWSEAAGELFAATAQSAAAIMTTMWEVAHDGK